MGGVSNVDIDGNNSLYINTLGAAISTFETRPNGGRNTWAPELLARRPDLTMETIEAYLHNLFRVQPDFVYSVSRDFARSCQTPMLVMPDDTPGHPYQVSMDIAALAPKADVTVYPWREPKDLWVKTVQQVRDFLTAHQPVAAAR